jgi:hypothetical protein
MRILRYLVYGIFLIVAFRAAEQPVSAMVQCNQWGCSADVHLLECVGYDEPYACSQEEGWSEWCSSLGNNSYFSGWSCGDGYFHFYCSYQGEPC